MNGWLLLGASALCYVASGVAMKMSDSLTHWRPSLVIYVAVMGAATLQTYGMANTKMSIGYAVVLGLEAILALGLSVLLLQERITAWQLLGTGLVISGVAMLRASG